MSIIDDYYKSNTSNKETPILLNNIYIIINLIILISL